MSERIYVTKDDKITVNENNLVNLTLQNGDVYEKLEPRRLFPVSRIPQKYAKISVIQAPIKQTK